MKKHKITSTELYFENLPKELDGLKIAHLSDLHSYIPIGIAEDIKTLSPDITVITGDIVSHSNTDFDGIYELLKSLCTLSPIYAVSGNHDARNPLFEDFKAEIQTLGVNFIDDSFASFQKGGAEIGIFGIKDPNVFKSAKLDAELSASFSALPEYDGFKILLMHRADLFPRVSGFDLILSGHMHGGQICLPNGRGILSPKSSIIGIKKPFFPDYTAGLYTKDYTQMYVSRGLSNPTVLPRIFNDTELVSLTLKRGGVK